MFLFAITNKSFDFISYKKVDELISYNLDKINYRNNGNKNKLLYEALIKPIEDQIKEVKKLYISTDGFLNEVAIEILSKTGTKFNLLEDKYEIVYVENGKTILKIDEKNKVSDLGQFIIYGGINYDCSVNTSKKGDFVSEIKPMQLSGSKKEINQLNEKLQNQLIKPIVVSDCEANKTSFLNHIMDKSYSHIHVSTHGILNNTQSANNYFSHNVRSQLLFAKESEYDDPYISAIEILNQNMSDKELVFLSACNTGKGTYLSGYGNASIANAFKKAGAKQVVSTLWPIPDDISAELSNHFYNAYLDSKNAHMALKLAKLHLRNKYSPEKWAAFRVLN